MSEHTLTLQGKTEARVKDLIRRSRCENLSHLIQTALAAYDLSVQCEEEGGEVILRRPDGVEDTLVVRCEIAPVLRLVPKP